MIHLLRANGDLLPEVEGGTITFEKNVGIINTDACTGVCGSLSFSRRTDVSASQAAPVVEEFIEEVRSWIAETFRLEPAGACRC